MLTRPPKPAIPKRVGRNRINAEQTPARFPEGTLRAIDALCAEGENRSDFIRTAVRMEIFKRIALLKQAGKEVPLDATFPDVQYWY